MKLLEDSFSYANQLGARQGAGAVYLHAHHPDIMRFLDTKRENADEKIRIKTLSLGVVIPDITFELAKKNEDMYLFSPYDVERVYGKPFGDVRSPRTTEHGRRPAHQEDQDQGARVLPDPRRDPVRVGLPVHRVRGHGEQGQPDQGPDQHVEPVLGDPAGQHADDLQRGPVLQPDRQGHLLQPGLAEHRLTMDSPDFGKTIETAIRALTAVSNQSHITSVPSIEDGNDKSHAIGLGQMNLHGYLARERIFYGSEEGIDFTNIYFYTVLFHALRASNQIAIERGEVFDGFEDSKYASGEFFDKYTDAAWVPETEKVARAVRRRRRAHPHAGRLAGAEGLGPGARHLQPEPAGRAADRLDLVHQQLDVVDPPGRRRRSRSARKASSAASTTRRRT